MPVRRKYIKRQQSTVTAVQLDLDTTGFSYRKWGGEQRCKPGDWLVNNNGDVYTVGAETFAKTYREISPGVYRKVAPVWAELAVDDGEIKTQEGTTRYRSGDYLVYNDQQGLDGYAVSAEKFEDIYRPLE